MQIGYLAGRPRACTSFLPPTHHYALIHLSFGCRDHSTRLRYCWRAAYKYQFSETKQVGGITCG